MKRVGPRGCIDPLEYVRFGLGPLPPSATPRALYLDLVKRAVANILYQDAPFGIYDHRKYPIKTIDFDLERRVLGEDLPTVAHSLIGIRRLDNIQYCVEDVLRQGVPGDLVEAGVARGGATIFMRAILKAYGVSERRVFACDAFAPLLELPPRWAAMVIPVLKAILYALTAVPTPAWQRKVFLWLQRRGPSHRSFPDAQDPSDELVRFAMWSLRHLDFLLSLGGTGLDDVRSYFARYGLLDDQVVFLKGFFANTLPRAPIERIAVLRLDADLYESTMDALILLYPKLSLGGYCIVDDFHSFSDCQRAVEEYRRTHDIRDELQPIDNLSVYWQKS